MIHHHVDNVIILLSIVPSSPPQNVMAADVDPASLSVTWQSPPLRDQNGPLLGYFISYHRTDDVLNSGSMSVIGTESIISGLDPYVSYSVQVAARNDRGLGTFSSIIDQVSGQDSKSHSISNIYKRLGLKLELPAYYY